MWLMSSFVVPEELPRAPKMYRSRTRPSVPDGVMITPTFRHGYDSCPMAAAALRLEFIGLPAAYRRGITRVADDLGLLGGDGPIVNPTPAPDSMR